MYDLALSAKTHDLILDSSGDLILIDNAERVAQQIKITLLLFKGEWFLNTAAGMPYFEEILVKNPNLAHVKQKIYKAIMSVLGVTSVDYLDLAVDPLTRRLKVRYAATTSYGRVEKLEDMDYGK